MAQYNLIIIGTGNIAKGLIFELLNISLHNHSVFINVYLYSQLEERVLGYLHDLQDALLMKEKLFNQKANIKFNNIKSINDSIRLANEFSVNTSTKSLKIFLMGSCYEA